MQEAWVATKKAKKCGTGAHLLLPKKFLGQQFRIELEGTKHNGTPLAEVIDFEEIENKDILKELLRLRNHSDYSILIQEVSKQFDELSSWKEVVDVANELAENGRFAWGRQRAEQIEWRILGQIRDGRGENQ